MIFTNLPLVGIIFHLITKNMDVLASGECEECNNFGFKVNNTSIKGKVEEYINATDDVGMKCLITDDVTNMKELFKSKSTFNGDISCWKTASVTTMERMFFMAVEFNRDISSWDVSSVTAMGNIFHGVTAFSGDLSKDLSNWDDSSVRKMAATDTDDFFCLPPDEKCDDANQYNCKMIKDLIKDGDDKGCDLCYNKEANLICPVTCKYCPIRSSVPSRQPTTIPSISLIPSSYPSTFSAVPSERSLIPSASSIPTIYPSRVPSVSVVPSDLPTVTIVPSSLPTAEVTNFDADFFLPAHKNCTEALSCQIIKKWMKDKYDNKGCIICSNLRANSRCPITCEDCTTSSEISRSLSNETSSAHARTLLILKDVKHQFSFKGDKKIYTCKKFKKGIKKGKSKYCEWCSKYSVNEICQKSCAVCDVEGDFYLPEHKECTKVLSCDIIEGWIKLGNNEGCDICYTERGIAKCPVTCTLCQKTESPTITSLPTMKNFPSSLPTKMPSLTPSLDPTQSFLPTNVPSSTPTVAATDMHDDFYLPAYKECAKALTCKRINKWIINDGKYKPCNICHFEGGNAKCPVACSKCPNLTAIPSIQPNSKPENRVRFLTTLGSSTNSNNQKSPARARILKKEDIAGRFSLVKTGDVRFTCKQFEKGIKVGEVKWCVMCLKENANKVCPITCGLCPRDSKDHFYHPHFEKCTKKLKCKMIKKLIKEDKKKEENRGCNICHNGGDAICTETCWMCL